MSSKELFLVPRPKSVAWSEAELKLLPATATAPALPAADKVFLRELRAITGTKKLPALSLKVRSGCVKTPCADQAYTLKVAPEGVTVEANTGVGALYALSALRQLKVAPGVFQCAEITDYPDMELRIAARPLICAEACRSALDWGDGKRNFLKRWREEIDFAMRYRYNGIFCHGFDLNTNAWPGFVRDIRALNRYAKARGVKLIFGLYGISIGGWGGDNYLSEGHAYVHGCGYGVEQDYICGFNNPAKPETGKHGTCRSFEELRQKKVSDLATFIRTIEPGALYIHHEDISSLPLEWRPSWLKRCDSCRRRWPNDAVEAPDGSAGALAYGFDAFTEARKLVKKPGYDAERDCTLILCSPCYGQVDDPDPDWNIIETLWLNVAKLMKNGKNVYLGLREQFVNHGDGKQRFAEFRRKLDEAHCDHKLFVFFVSGAALYGNNAVFSSTPELSSYMRGADTVFLFSGVIFQRPQILFNAECNWNRDYRPGGVTVNPDLPADEIFKKYYTMSSPENMIEAEHKKPESWLDKACRLLYGERAGKSIFAYQSLLSPYQDAPLSILFMPAMMEKILNCLTGPEPEKAVRKGLRWLYPAAEQVLRWKAAAKITREGRGLIEAAAETTPDGALKRELIQQISQLSMGELFAEAVAELFRLRAEKCPAAAAKKAVKAWEKAVAGLPFDYVSELDGDGSCFPKYTKEMKRLLALGEKGELN